MSDPTVASPFLGLSQTIRPLPHFSRAILRVGLKDVARASERLDLALPIAACTATGGSAMGALWLGPDEWLLIGEAGLGNGLDWMAGITEKLGDVVCSLVDVSHRQVALEISGERAEIVLAYGCALDLSITAFPVGMCTRTMYHKAEIVLWRKAPDRFHLEVWRSFARYVEALVRQAESEA
ncbi:sarcosine oxidase subunit gamma [Sphingosinicella microcystinivorans]|uniref:Sarcosine oxidase subunit gamma n=1 Tax=Sphingosinicella microcystinivorans TaxID=335406 RepID=A0AAD1G0T4_SPHMI|nr:sarcosine oxidase subunit gamma family protein [Sphingosinicella microcystinivorans]RKS91228.1 sarcosine oxidase subunit gamma [Sphingosinicella microcystinivorans]BBE34197.1 sarcosine oxidase subunit gamma [Sphingosinicella microcystinivorans]